MKIALFPGSFDPMTNGHLALVERAVPLFDKLVIGIGYNNQKQYLFSLEQRKAWIEEIFRAYPNVSVASYEGLTIDFCKQIGAQYIVRGFRSAPDFEYERSIAQFNRRLAGIETVFLITDPEYSHISSTIVRELIRYGSDVSPFIPKEIKF